MFPDQIPSSPFQSNHSMLFAGGQQSVQIANGKREDKWDPVPPNEKPNFQEGFHCVSLRDPIRLGLYEDAKKGSGKIKWKDSTQFSVTKNVFQTLTQPQSLIAQYEPLIRHHVAMRVAHFFQQAVVCYNTPFYFKIADTEGQYFSAPTLSIKSESNQAEKITYQAAHSSTIPDLNACFREEMKETGTSPQFFTFLRGSHVNTLGNSTVGLPTCVNQMDTLIDGKSSNIDPKKGLRARTTHLINEVALAKIDPCEATRLFLKDFQEIIPIRIKASRSITQEKSEVIKIYQEQIQEMIQQASIPNDTQNVHPFFDGLMNVNVSMDNAEDIPIIRKIVFKQKYSIIRESQFTECKIQELVKQYSLGKSQEDTHFFKLSLVYQCQTQRLDLKKMLEKLFCISYETIKGNSSLVKSLQQFYTQNTTLHQDVLRDIRLAIRNYQKMEQCFQAMLLKSFRTTLRNKTRKELSDSLKTVVEKKLTKELSKPTIDQHKINIIKSLPTSTSTIYRLENSNIHIIKNYKTPENQRRKILTPEQAKFVAKALEIQVGHLFCSMFASKYEG